MEGCLANIVKYLLFATNFLVFVMGCVVLGFGIYALIDGADLVDLIDLGGDSSDTITLYSTSAIILIVVSIVVIFITFFGCCGAIKENRCMLGTYFTIVLALFIIMIVGAVIGYGQSMEEIKNPLRKSMGKFDISGQSPEKDEQAITEAWNQIQIDYDCCGVDNATDWWISGPYPKPGTASEAHVPESCCEVRGDIKNSTDCQYNPQNYEKDLTGCITKLQQSIDDNATNVLAVGVTIVVIMFMNMLFAFALCTMSSD